MRISGGWEVDIVILGRFGGWIFAWMCILSDINDIASEFSGKRKDFTRISKCSD